MKRILLSSIIVAGLLNVRLWARGGGQSQSGVFMSMTGGHRDSASRPPTASRWRPTRPTLPAVNGKQIELDDAGRSIDPSEAATIVTNVCDAGWRDAILVKWPAPRSIAAAPIAPERQNSNADAVVNESGSNRKGDYIFRSCFIDPVQGAAIAQFAAPYVKAQRPHHGRSQNDYSPSGTVIKAPSPGWVERWSNTVYQAGDQDFNAQITSIKGANPDVIFRSGLYGDVALFANKPTRVSQCRWWAATDGTQNNCMRSRQA